MNPHLKSNGGGVRSSGSGGNIGCLDRHEGSVEGNLVGNYKAVIFAPLAREVVASIVCVFSTASG